MVAREEEHTRQGMLFPFVPLTDSNSRMLDDFSKSMLRLNGYDYQILIIAKIFNRLDTGLIQLSQGKLDQFDLSYMLSDAIVVGPHIFNHYDATLKDFENIAFDWRTYPGSEERLEPKIARAYNNVLGVKDYQRPDGASLNDEIEIMTKKILAHQHKTLGVKYGNEYQIKRTREELGELNNLLTKTDRRSKDQLRMETLDEAYDFYGVTIRYPMLIKKINFNDINEILSHRLPLLHIEHIKMRGR